MQFSNTLRFAKSLDKNDPLRKLRKRFYFPKHEGNKVIYLCGNSLGLEPKEVKPALLNELEHWKNYAVEGHFKGSMPWMYYHKFLSKQTAKIVGAKEEEVVVMNTLTTNLHLMMVSFYRPTSKRYKIIMEAGAFPSDQYAMETQVKWHAQLGDEQLFNPEDAIIEVAPRSGEEILRTIDIVRTIAEHGDSVALVMFGGVNYYTGQFFDLDTICKAGHEAGAKVGFDLAHAAGNVPLKLHEWGVDFAIWCSYKYLNSGPGGPSGVFVHEKHGSDPSIPRFGGWWGHDEESRFLMKKGFHPMEGASGWQLSNAQILSFAAHKVSLDLFEEVGLAKLREKSILLTAYMQFLIKDLNKRGANFNIITPMYKESRGAQLSILTDNLGKKLFDYLTKNGVISDWREPNVIRVAAVPMYNSFKDVWEFVNLLKKFSKE